MTYPHDHNWFATRTGGYACTECDATTNDPTTGKSNK